jgi:NAD(P)-dependent dehydrogenase (short-subunit alcohol dehydrogenase family)
MQFKRIALVTGANQGVGLRVAKQLVANGVTVLVGSRNFERGEAAAKEIGPGAIALQLDATDRVSIATAAERIRKEFGRLDLLVNNAAISNTRKGSLSLHEYAKITLPSKVSLDDSVSSPFSKPCCRSSASRRTPASSTCRAESAR